MHDHDDCWDDDCEECYEEGYDDGYNEGRRRQSSRGTRAVIERNKRRNQENGCYIATAVYGSYDCPEVWVLRRFRDNFLARKWYGRVFIRVYYAISPTFVKLFGESKCFKSFWHNRLDCIIEQLHEEGIDDSPYQDVNWR